MNAKKAIHKVDQYGYAHPVSITFPFRFFMSLVGIPRARRVASRAESARRSWITALRGLLSTSALSVADGDLLRAVARQPQLLYQKPATLNHNVEASARLLGLAKERFVAAALRQPPLLQLKPATLNHNVETSARLFGVSKERFVVAALKTPQLLYQNPATLNHNVEASARLFGVSKERVVAAALKHPPLFTQKPATLDANVEASTRLLGLAKERFVATAMRQPSLFCYKPATLNGNVEGSAALLGLAKKQFLAVALKQPHLFSLRPATLNAKKPYILKLSQALGDVRDFASLVQDVPSALTYSIAHLHARCVLVELGLARGAFTSVVMIPAAKVASLMVGHKALTRP